MYSNTGQLSFQIMGVSSYVYLLVARTAPQINVNSSSVLMQAPPVGTGFKPDLWQSKCYTSQAMWHKIQGSQVFTTRNAQNPLSTVQLLHEYRLPEEPEILSIC